jgi:hypothetical protein
MFAASALPKSIGRFLVSFEISRLPENCGPDSGTPQACHLSTRELSTCLHRPSLFLHYSHHSRRHLCISLSAHLYCYLNSDSPITVVRHSLLPLIVPSLARHAFLVDFPYPGRPRLGQERFTSPWTSSHLGPPPRALSFHLFDTSSDTKQLFARRLPKGITKRRGGYLHFAWLP